MMSRYYCFSLSRHTVIGKQRKSGYSTIATVPDNNKLVSKRISKVQLPGGFTQRFGPTDQTETSSATVRKRLYDMSGCLRSVGADSCRFAVSILFAITLVICKAFAVIMLGSDKTGHKECCLTPGRLSQQLQRFLYGQTMPL